MQLERWRSVNYLFYFRWTNALDWSGKDEFNKQAYTKWNVNGSAAGEYKQVDNLTFLKIYEAGHMVPMDQAVNAVEMLNEFISDP